MISVLLPCYNCIPKSLVGILRSQFSEANVAYEIVIGDDGSSSEFHKELNALDKPPSVRIIRSDQNLGRSCIRNRLIDKAVYEWVLFLDGDLEIRHPSFLNRFLEEINRDLYAIVYGGRRHEPFEKDKKKLRITYALNHEECPSYQRQKEPFKHLFFNNTLIKKEILLRCRFDTSLKEYGHEDTLLAYQLSKEKYKVLHIENPAYGITVDENFLFLKKTRQGLRNLGRLIKSGKLDPRFVKLSAVYNVLRPFGLAGLLSVLFPAVRKTLEWNLLSANPNLALFSFYKLLYYCWYQNKL